MTLSSKRAIFAGLAVDSSRWHLGGRISRSIRLFSVGAAVQQGGPVNGIHYDSHLLRVTPDQTSARYMRPATPWWGRRTSFWWLRDRCSASAFISRDPYRGASPFLLIERQSPGEEEGEKRDEIKEKARTTTSLTRRFSFPPHDAVIASSVRRDL